MLVAEFQNDVNPVTQEYLLDAIERGEREGFAAVVIELDGHHYALTVDMVEDVLEATSEPAPVRAGMVSGWERVSTGIVETEHGPLLLLDVAALVAGPEAKAA